MQFILFVSILLTLFITTTYSAGIVNSSAFGDTNKIYTKNDTSGIIRIAFGSCNKTVLPQPMWQFITLNNPDLWIWLGDNIYGDTEDMGVLKYKYDMQYNHPEYAKLRNKCPIIGTWDDHDYGANNAGKEYPKKEESKSLLLDFLDEPKNSERREREGVYVSYTLGEGDKTIKIILLDARTFRDQLHGVLPNLKGDILGETQWKWLTQELNTSTASINIICNGTQMISPLHNNEKWANFPKARKKLFKIIAESKAKRVLLLSGDRHFGELSKIEIRDIPYPVYEITSSGLTHSYRELKGELNPYRVQDFVKQLNFGMIEVDWNAVPVQIRLQIRGVNNHLYVEEIIPP